MEITDVGIRLMRKHVIRKASSQYLRGMNAWEGSVRPVSNTRFFSVVDWYYHDKDFSNTQLSITLYIMNYELLQKNIPFF